MRPGEEGNKNERKREPRPQSRSCAIVLDLRSPEPLDYPFPVSKGPRVGTGSATDFEGVLAESALETGLPLVVLIRSSRQVPWQLTEEWQAIVDKIEKAVEMHSNKGLRNTLTDDLLPSLERMTAAPWECRSSKSSATCPGFNWVMTANS